MDVLSEVLKVVKLLGALFYNAEFSSPWSVYAASSDELARYYGIDAEHVIVYHLLTEGPGSVRLDNGSRLNLEAGDIVWEVELARPNHAKKLPIGHDALGYCRKFYRPSPCFSSKST